MLSDQDRIARQQRDPALLRLWRALGRLRSVLTVMNTGAHPDDEHSGLLAALRFGYGFRVVVACATRGEGGQNAIGPERGSALGALRTREMEAAARSLDASIAWLGLGPDDPVHDFGFSKTGDDTLARWGEERVIEQLVGAFRAERPDIVLPTFLDVGGQHGHHRAMTRAALAAFRLSGDPACFPAQIAAGLKPWRPAKLYLPAWSGAGASYDDEEPPPPATLRVEPPRRDPAMGATFAQIGEWSRACHASQGMGVWREDGPYAWPLYLLARADGVSSEEGDIRDGLPADLAALAGEPGLPPTVGDALRQAQEAAEAAASAFPDGPSVAASALSAARSVEAAASAADPRLEHRLARKLRELDAVVFAARGVVARAAARPAGVMPGRAAAIEVFVDSGETPAEARLVAGPHWRETGRWVGVADGRTAIALHVASDAEPTSPYPADFDPLGGNGEVAVEVALAVEGRRVVQAIDLEEPLRVLPPASLRLDPDAALVNLALPRRDIAVTATPEGEGADAGALAWNTPPGWGVTSTAEGVRLSPPARAEAGRFTIRPHLGGDAVRRVAAIRYPHIEPTLSLAPVEFPVLAVDAALPEGAKVGYAGGGNDQVGIWLERLGLDTVELDAARLAGDLGDLTTVVVGILAFGTRPDLAAARPRLRAWVEAGGHLVTLYHRPRDAWDPDRTPPRHLRIGLPSVRWRVTDPDAPVRTIAPDHPLLTRPNAIGLEDWAGWDKERGLYFAAEWDPAYVPLLALSDPGERPLNGALLSGTIGSGRHTHVSLALHHQLDRLVPGAFRLLANLVQPA